MRISTPSLTLSISGPAGANHESVPNISKSLKAAVLHRDFNVCQFCSFRSLKYQETVALSRNLHDIDQIVTACIFCHQCLYLDEVVAMRSGVLLWLPEIGQAELHVLAREIYVARISTGSMAQGARHAIELLMKRREAVKKRIGTDDPAKLAPRMRRLENIALDGVRLFPLDRRILSQTEFELEYNVFPQILAYWRTKDGPLQSTVPLRALESYLRYPFLSDGSI